MPIDIEGQISAYFDWVERSSGFELHPPGRLVDEASVDVTTDRHPPGDGVSRLDQPPMSSSRPRSRALIGTTVTLLVVAGLAAIGTRPETAPMQSDAPQPTDTRPATSGAAACAEPEAVIGSPWKACIDMLVYIKPEASDDQIELVRSTLLQLGQFIDTTQVRYVDVAASVENAARILADDPDTLALLNEQNIPTGFEVVALPNTTARDLRSIGDALEELPGVLNVQVRGEAAIAPDITNEPTPSNEPTTSNADPVETTASVGTEPMTIPVAIAIGDQVMLGAASQLDDRGFLVDAAEARSIDDVTDVVRDMNRRNQTPAVVVISAGTNGPISETDLDQLMTELSGVQRVIMLTIKPNHVTGNSNEEIRALPWRSPNVEVLDWATLAADCPGECFYTDDIHLRTDGQEYFAQLVADAVNSPAS